MPGRVADLVHDGAVAGEHQVGQRLLAQQEGADLDGPTCGDVMGNVGHCGPMERTM